MFKDLLLALFTPTRRLPVLVYIALKIPLMIAAGVLVFNLCNLGRSDGGAWLALHLVLLWMSFCIIANRFHDGGVSAGWVMPAYALAAISFIYHMDPSVVGYDQDVQEMWGERLYFAQRILKLGACIILGLSIKLPTETGRNRFGMPFGEKDWATKPDLGGRGIASAPQAAQFRKGVPVRVVETVEPTPAPWPVQGRPRRAGFGQR
jgi:uncharacterized membrane protein YhaH (DUF805 family)